MKLPFQRRKKYVYCGTVNSALLAEVGRSRDGKPELRNVVSGSGSPVRPGTLRRLFSQALPAAGTVAMALPVHFFEIVNLALPMLPDEAVGRTLPYHLAKAVDKPLSDYIFDWQITRRLRDQLHVVAYLFPAKMYRELQEEFHKNHLETVFFEADVFAAFAYLDLNGLLRADAGTLCAIAWPDSLSLAVCEAGRLELARSVELPQPEQQAAVAGEAMGLEAVSAAADGETTEGLGKGRDDEVNSLPEAHAILAGFDIFPAANGSSPPDSGDDLLVLETAEPQDKTAGPSPWDDYLESINIEIMRTKDYYASVIKGKKITSYYVLGADDFFAQLQGVVRQATGEELQMLSAQPAAPRVIPPCRLSASVSPQDGRYVGKDQSRPQGCLPEASMAGALWHPGRGLPAELLHPRPAAVCYGQQNQCG